MKRINKATVCYAISILLFLAFIIHTIVDYNRYYNSNILTAAPFYLWIVVNIVYFIVPAIIFLIIGIIIKNKQKST